MNAFAAITRSFGILSADELRSCAVGYGWLLASIAGAYALGWLIGLARVVLGRLGRGGASLTRPTCRACRSLVRGDAHVIPDRCSECGADTSNDYAIRLIAFPEHHGLRRAITAILAAGMTLASLGAIVGFTIAVRPGAIGRASSNRQPPTPPSPQEQSTPILKAIVDRSIEQARAARAAERDLRWLDEAAELVRRNELELDRVNRLLAELGAMPTFDMLERVGPGSEVCVRFALPYNAPPADIILEDLRLDGSPRDVVTDPLPHRVLGATHHEFWAFAAPEEPGIYEVQIQWRAGWKVNEESWIGQGPETARRTLVVSSEPERLRRRTDLAASPFAEAIGWPLLTIGGRDDEARHALGWQLPALRTRLVGRWTLLVGRSRHELPVVQRPAEFGQGFAICFVDRPVSGWPEQVTVLFEPTLDPVVAFASQWTGPLNPGFAPTKTGRHISEAWSRTTELRLRRAPSNPDLPSERRYELEAATSVETPIPTAEGHAAD
jgi:hypothetical protein